MRVRGAVQYRLCGDRRGADGVVNVQSPSQLVRRVAIEDAQDHADAWMDRARIEADLEADQIIVHEAGDGRGLFNCPVYQGVRDRRVRDHHRDSLLANRGQKMVVRIFLDDEHRIVLRAQALDEVVADSAQPTDDDVADEAMTPPSKNDLSTSRDNTIDEQREKH